MSVRLILLGCKNVLLDLIQVLEVQQHESKPKLNVRPQVRENFEDMVTDALNVEDSTNMSTKPVSVIEFKGDLAPFSLNEN